ncbi:flavin reductase family protein [Roseiconus nitratireducens]|uniref:Flavin reductase family protein n=1 Tax=Roseiconus nitratireducens TaxID=2605748 RepID=A0A5M6DCY7_9BACT|nr:flavin reductase family protein [Roseiconus nitratireducens]KAA5545378.1 flavin reductase family protein [Roseiconus nitratireducens]
MEFDVSKLSVQDSYLRMVQLISPRPIAWVSTLSIDGIPNLAPYSFFTGVGVNPPTICFSPANDGQGRPKDTLENIRQTGQFVVNIVTEPVAQAMHRTSDELAPEVNEFALAGVDPAASTQVKPPRVRSAVAAMECTLHSAIQLGAGPGGANLVIGYVVHLHIDDDLVDQSSIETVGRVGRREYTVVKDTFRLE